MKNLGFLNYFLGIEVIHENDGFYLSKAKFATNLLTWAQQTDSKVTPAPLKYNGTLTLADGTWLGCYSLLPAHDGLVYLTVN